MSTWSVFYMECSIEYESSINKIEFKMQISLDEIRH